MTENPIAGRLRAVGAEPVPDEHRQALRNATAAMRVVMERIVASAAPAEAIDAAAAELRAIADVLGRYPRGRTYDFSESSIAGDPSAFFDNSPVAGVSNPLAPPLNLRIEDGKVIGDVRWGSAYEGAPGCVHGGYVAAAFDEVLGLAQDLGGHPGMTGTLTIKYRKPTPIHTDLHFVGEFTRSEGRKTFTEGWLYDPEGNLLAESDAVFISVDMGKLRDLAMERGKQTPAP
ncbi:MAG: hypothetical protein QOJ00_1111 [Actinomycetota bacterium]|jgi:acyl-coenzyme A thioesterase PaaI-like protein